MAGFVSRVYWHVLQPFPFMEGTGSFDVNSDIDMFSLHYVFLLKIQRSLHAFQIGWNNHPMHSERGLSPEQQWVQGLALYHGGASYTTLVCPLVTLIGILWLSP